MKKNSIFNHKNAKKLALLITIGVLSVAMLVGCGPSPAEADDPLATLTPEELAKVAQLLEEMRNVQEDETKEEIEGIVNGAPENQQEDEPATQVEETKPVDNTPNTPQQNAGQQYAEKNDNFLNDAITREILWAVESAFGWLDITEWTPETLLEEFKVLNRGVCREHGVSDQSDAYWSEIEGRVRQLISDFLAD